MQDFPQINIFVFIIALLFFGKAIRKTFIPIWIKRYTKLREEDIEMKRLLLSFARLFGERNDIVRILNHIVFIDLMQNENYDIDYYHEKYGKDYKDIGAKFPLLRIKLMIRVNKNIVYWENHLEEL